MSTCDVYYPPKVDNPTATNSISLKPGMHGIEYIVINWAPVSEQAPIGIELHLCYSDLDIYNNKKWFKGYYSNAYKKFIIHDADGKPIPVEVTHWAIAPKVIIAKVPDTTRKM